MAGVWRVRLLALPLLLALGGGLSGPARAQSSMPYNPAVVPTPRYDRWWWRLLHARRLARIREGNVGMIWVGDSITQDWMRDGPQSFVRFHPLWRRLYGRYDAVNLGVQADTTANALWRIENGEVAGISPRVAVVEIGANDLLLGHWDAALTLPGIEAVVAALRARLPATHIVLLGILPNAHGPWVARQSAVLNAALARAYAADPAVTFLDVGQVLYRGGRLNPSLFVESHFRPPRPLTHPDPEGMARIAAAIGPTIARWMGSR